jgi:hypothetical protein
MNKLFKRTLWVAAIHFLICLALWWATWPDFESTVPPDRYVRFLQIVLGVMTWPVRLISESVLALVISSLLQGFLIVLGWCRLTSGCSRRELSSS